MEPKFEPKPGEKEFFGHFEKNPSLAEIQRQPAVEPAKQKIKEFIKSLEAEIEGLPEIKREADIHHQPLSQLANILAEAVSLALEKGIFEGLAFVKKIGNPYLIDAFHDLLAGHFFEALIQHQKIKINS